MWMIGSSGFVSIVQKPGDEARGQLTLRARVRADLQALQTSVLPDMGPIKAHAGTDYPYRATAPREAVALAMAQSVRKIDYANFKHAVAARQGRSREAVYSDVWEALLGLEQLPVSAPTLVVPHANAYGGVLIDVSGRVLLREPQGHYGGYAWTFAKGRPDKGETPAATGLREVLEETGYAARIVALVPGVYPGTSSDTTVMFLMEPVGDPRPPANETVQIRWCDPAQAEALIRLSPAAAGRARDLAILAAAYRAWRATVRT